MKLYDAIAEMRRLSRDGIPFSFTYMSYNSSRGTTDGIVHVQQARLVQREDEKHNRYAEDQERYYNLTTGEVRRFWHPLLMFLNGETVKI